MVDKKINEKDFLPGQQLPIEIIPVQDAWSEMRKKLEDEMPGAVVGSQYQDAKQKNSLQKRTLRITLLFLLLLITLFFIKLANRQQENSKEAGSKVSSIDEKQSAGEGSLPDDKNQTVTEKSVDDPEKNKTDSQQETIDPNNFLEKDRTQSNDLRNVTTKKKNNASKQNHSSVKIKKKRKSSFNNLKNSDTKEIVASNNSNEKQTMIDEASSEKDISIDNAIDTITKKKMTKDSVKITQAEAEDEAPQYKPIISAGLQWNFQLPVYSADNYFKGSSATSQAYRVLLPGAWISVNAEKHLMRAELNPFYSTLFPAKPFGTFTTYSTIPDTIITITETKTLRKTFGIFISADYNYNFSSNLWVGGGIYAYWQRKGITSGSGVEERRSISNGGIVSGAFNKSYVLTTAEWENFARFQLGIHAEVFYSSKKMQTGFRIGLPVNNVARHQGQKYSVRSEMIFRLPLFFSDNKK